MTDVASRELRNETRKLLDRVASGERLTITVGGRRVAELAPIATRPAWMPRQQFASSVLPHQADSSLTEELASITGDETTDDLRFE